MLNRLRLWWLELRLEGQLGKHDAYLNRVYEANATDNGEKARIALDVLRSPPLNKGQRWAEHQKLVGRQMGVLADQPEPAEPEKSPQLSGSFRVLFQKMALRGGKSGTSSVKESAPRKPVS